MDKPAAYVDVTPDWRNLAMNFAQMLSQGTFELPCYGPVASFIEMIRYLSLTDPEAVEFIIRHLSVKENQKHVQEV